MRMKAKNSRGSRQENGDVFGVGVIDVARTCRLPSRRFVIGDASASSKTHQLVGASQNSILRYGRGQLCATPDRRRPMAGRNPRVAWATRTRFIGQALKQGLATLALVLALTSVFAPTARAVIKEPENLIWGNVLVGGKIVTRTQTDIVVEARRSLTGPTLASYRMGSSPAAGDFYSLALPLESVNPISHPNATQTGETVLVLVHNGQFVRYLTLYTVGGRGQLTRLDLGDIDSDNNGLIDNWERQYFGAAGQDANGDPDRDGVGNRNEMLGGTNPLLPDSRHPADINPTNNVVTIHEVAKYALAWKTGQSWPVAPTNIPVEFVARAGYLWKNGEAYKLDTNYLAAGAPLWWTNVPPSSAQGDSLAGVGDASRSVAKQELSARKLSESASRVRRVIAGEPALSVTLNAVPAGSISAYVVEEGIPEGWTPSAINENGVFDSATRRIRWGLFFDHTERALSYRLEPAEGLSGTPRLSGVGSFDGWNVATEGAGTPPPPVSEPLRLAVANGRLSLELTAAEPGAQYEIQVSNDLQNWTSVATITANSDGKLEFADDVKTAVAPQRFFRARRLENPDRNGTTR